MVTIKVSKNLDDYEEHVIGEFNISKTYAIIKAAISGGVVLFLAAFILKLPLIISCYAAMPFMLYFIYKGFYSKDGRTYEEAKRLDKGKKYFGANYCCASGNDLYFYDELLKKYKKNQELELKDSEDAFDTMLNKYKMIGWILLAVISCLITLIIVIISFI